MAEVENIGLKIRKIRELKNYSRHYMARQLHISITTYGKIERGEIDLTLSRLSLLAGIFNISLTSIIEFDENKLFR